MTNPLDAPFYADSCQQRVAEIVENVPIARDTWRMRIAAGEIAAAILPGQFFMVRATGVDDPLIGRPFAMYDVAEDCVDFVYLRHGKMTQYLARMVPGQSVDVWGPLGNGFVPAACQHLIMVAGGIGQTPFLAVAKERLGKATYGGGVRLAKVVPHATLCYGARSADLLAGIAQFQAAGVDVHIATDDGSRGHNGLVTDLVSEILQQSTDGVRLLACGPHAMMAAASRLAANHQVPCEVSLEEPMACGVGICFTCVARIRGEGDAASGDDSWDWKRTCVEGPVFAADRVDWSDR